VLAFSDPRRYLARYSEPDKIAFGLDRADAWPVPFWDTDTAMACMLLLLAAVDEGLGGWLFGIDRGESELRTELGVPDDRRLMGVVGLGYADPAEVPKGSGSARARRPLEEQVHRNGW
jgi:nitroreductase